MDGILLPGGDDVLPSLYGAAAASDVRRGRTRARRVRTRAGPARADADLPLFAICRGIQVLNVARGGTLVQDIPSELPGAVSHQVRDTPFTIAHDIWISEGTLLLELLRDRIEGDACPVNSRHHQAVRKVGDGLVVSATAPDGVVEAVEDPASGSASACSGTRRTSTAPESFARCSRRSSTPREKGGTMNWKRAIAAAFLRNCCWLSCSMPVVFIVRLRQSPDPEQSPPRLPASSIAGSFVTPLLLTQWVAKRVSPDSCSTALLVGLTAFVVYMIPIVAGGRRCSRPSTGSRTR